MRIESYSGRIAAAALILLSATALASDFEACPRRITVNPLEADQYSALSTAADTSLFLIEGDEKPRLAQIFEYYSSDNDPYGFKRFFYLIQTLGLQQARRKITGTELKAILEKYAGNDFKRDPVFGKLVDGMDSIQLERVVEDGRPVVQAKLVTRDRQDLVVHYTGEADGVSFDDSLKIENGSQVKIAFPTDSQIQSFIRQGNSALTKLGSKFSKDLREMISINNQYMLRARQAVASYLQMNRPADRLEPIYLHLDGISLTSEGQTAHVAESTILPGLSVQGETAPWMYSGDEVSFFRGYAKIMLFKGYMTTVTN